MVSLKLETNKAEDFYYYFSKIFAIPIALMTLLYNLATFLVGLVLIPPKLAIYLVTTFPILTTVFFITLFIMFWLIRRLTRIDIINYFFYTVIPYGLSILYTVMSFIFPQIHVLANVFAALLHPISWFLTMMEKIDQRARPIRRTVEAMRDNDNYNNDEDNRRPKRRSRRIASKNSNELEPEERQEDRIQCCVCMVYEKSILLQPCNHLCLCKKCLKEVKKTDICPICRTPIKNYINVYI